MRYFAKKLTELVFHNNTFTIDQGILEKILEFALGDGYYQAT
jgi:hypothetical protein